MLSTIMPYPRPASVDFSKLVTDGDQFKLQWCKQMSANRKEFYSTADLASRSLAPVRDQYRQAYKDFHQYLTTTIDMVELMPENIQHRLSLEYSSGISNNTLITVECGKTAFT